MADDERPFVVVGGDAAGLSAASKCRQEGPDRAVVVFEQGEWVSYAHCGTPYFVKGEVDRLDDLLSLSPVEIEARGIDLRRNHEVVDVDFDARTVVVKGPGGRIERPYGDRLVATGARAVTGPEGFDLGGAFSLHGLDAAAGVRAFLLDPRTDALADVGGGEFVDREAVERYGAMDPRRRSPSSAGVRRDRDGRGLRRPRPGGPPVPARRPRPPAVRRGGRRPRRVAAGRPGRATPPRDGGRTPRG